MAKVEKHILELDGHEVAVSNPSKLYFPRAGITKLELVQYYLAVAEGAIRGVARRPMILKRFVNGAESEAFYQKRVDRGKPPWVKTAVFTFPSGRTAEEVCVDDRASLIYVVNLGCLDLNPHAIRADDMDRPDELRIDLDPVPGVPWSQILEVAAVARDVLTEYGLVGWPKTSGNRGAHVWVRIERRWTFAEVRRAALAFAREVERRAPDDRDGEVVEGGAPGRVPRLQPERARSHDVQRVLGAADPRCARVDAARRGMSFVTLRWRPSSRCARCPRCIAIER